MKKEKVSGKRVDVPKRAGRFGLGESGHGSSQVTRRVELTHIFQASFFFF